MKNVDNKNRKVLKEKLGKYIYASKAQYFNIIETYIKGKIIGNEKIKVFVRNNLDEFRDINKQKSIIENIITQEKLQALDGFLKDKLFKYIDEKHEYIGKIVEESLHKYDSSGIAKLIEEKAGDDLQIIRINGSIVGGLVGIITFILEFLLRHF